MQENLVIGGLSWDEVSEDYCEGKLLSVSENSVTYNFCKPNPSHDIINHYFVCSDYDSTINDILDENIVETACKRSSYPKQIRNQVVRSLRAERKLLVRHVYFHIYIYIYTHTHTHTYLHSYIHTYRINKSQTNQVFNYWNNNITDFKY